MPWIHMTEEQRRNCLTFLNRTNLTGTEAEALVSLKMTLLQPTPDSDLVDAPKSVVESKGGDTNED